jgi:hypothetical protein
MQRETNRMTVNKSKIYPNRSSLNGTTVSENVKRYHAECNEVLSSLTPINQDIYQPSDWSSFRLGELGALEKVGGNFEACWNARIAIVHPVADK